MTRTNQAFITPEVMRWARERARATRDRLAKRLHTRPEYVASWEEGDAKPTFQQAERLADALSIPFGYLFLPSPPTEQIPLPDFRRLGGKAAEPPSADLIAVLNDVILKQEGYKELLIEEGRSPLAFVARFSSDDVPAEIAKDIRSVLNVDRKLRDESANWQEFLVALIKNAESAGILVMRSGVVASNPHRPLSVTEFRGFAVSDPIAPVVFLNGRDSQSAQIFTLVHELSHIWIGASGISNQNLGEERNQGEYVEQFCNVVTAETLVPSEEFRRTWNADSSIEENITNISRTFKVSTLVALRRGYDLRRITWENYSQHYSREERKFKSRDEKKKSGGNYYLNVLARNSAPLTRAVVNAAVEGRVLYRDAAYMLNVGVPSIQKIAGYLAKQRESRGR